MEISVVRRRLTETIERAKKQAAERRGRADQASRDFEVFLQKIAVPLFRQVANALKADGYIFTVFTPSGSVRLMSDRSASDYIELTLDASDDPARVMGQISRARGSRVLDAEHAIGAPDTLTEEQLLAFLLKELEAFVER
jgi:GAF domain-containing protein